MSAGRLSINLTKPGAFLMNSNTEVYQPLVAYYLQNHLSLKWEAVTGASVFDNHATIRFMTGDYQIGIGRRVVGGVTHLGRVA